MTALESAALNYQKDVTDLVEFLRIPSISTLPEHRPDMQRAAEWLAERLRRLGMDGVAIYPTAGHPVVYGEWSQAGPAAPTLLVYGHYDVQPVDPLDLWKSPPFEPTIVGDNLYARGAADDKGQLFIHLAAAQALIHRSGNLPVNIKYLFEGEEEIGSPHLDEFIDSHADLLAADVAVISDSHILGPDQPAIVYALRGLAYIEVHVYGPSRDLHSGIYGGAVHNPIQALCELIASLHDAEARVIIPGFYSKVRPLEPDERADLARIPFSTDQWLEETGVPAPYGEPDYTIVERTSARPTLEINGIWGGFTGAGGKTVIPAGAHAKISMRLVPDQEPQEIADLVAAHLKAIAPPTVRVEISELHHGDGAIIPRDIPAMQAARAAYRAAFGADPVFMREGGSIPVVATFQKILAIPTVMLGFGLPDDNLHSPNEKFNLQNFRRGVATVIHFLTSLGGQAAGQGVATDAWPETSEVSEDFGSLTP
ncbi:MAG TPA: dipeptidase [Chloroflexi bacterium]|nr:dipeptidase [Chloroflexota bacterium]